MIKVLVGSCQVLLKTQTHRICSTQAPLILNAQPERALDFAYRHQCSLHGSIYSCFVCDRHTCAPTNSSVVLCVCAPTLGRIILCVAVYLWNQIDSWLSHSPTSSWRNFRTWGGRKLIKLRCFEENAFIFNNKAQQRQKVLRRGDYHQLAHQCCFGDFNLNANVRVMGAIGIANLFVGK